MTFSEVLEAIPVWAAAITATVPVIELARRKVVKPFNQRIMQLSEQMTSVLKEVRPNGGTSLKDAVTRIENHLELNTMLTRNVIENDPRGVFQMDAQGNCLWVNRTFRRMVNQPASTLVGKGWISSIHPVDRDRIVTEFMHCITDQRQFRAKYAVTDGIGSPGTQVYGIATPLKGRDGKLLGFMGSIQVETPAAATGTYDD